MSEDLNNISFIRNGKEFEPTKRELKIVVEDLGIKIADLEAKLAEQQECSLKASSKHNLEMQNAQICVKELEAKLAESESKLRVSNSLVASSQLEYNQLKKEYDEQEKLLSKVLADKSNLQFEFDQLKQQLAEKDEINNLVNEQLKDMERSKLSWENQYFTLYNTFKNYREVVEKKDQDKISFAVEQLEQIFSDFNKKVDDEFGDNDVGYITLDIEDVNFYLQDKIKQLKEGK